MNRYSENHAYSSGSYAESFQEHGQPIKLPRSGSWVLERQVPGSDALDATALYPLFACPNWDELEQDIDALGCDWLTLAAVPDPMTSPDAGRLEKLFPDLVNPFKLHYLIDLDRPIAEQANKHHRYESRRAMKHSTVEVLEEPWNYVDDWTKLYAELVERHNISGLQDFSRSAFDAQLRCPGMIMLGAKVDGQIVGAHLWFANGETVTSHLAAFAPEGYKSMVSYAIYWRATEIFSDMGYRWMNIGGGAGAKADAKDGLTRFKRGWTSETRTAYFCGRILDRDRYEAITGKRDIEPGAFFPAYRAADFVAPAR